MHFAVNILLVLQICIYQCTSEWVQISQVSDDGKNATTSIDSKSKFTEFELSDHPSPEWIAYQKERFKDTNKSNRLVISGESHLKNSAEIIVPAQTGYPISDRSKIIRTKTKISLEDFVSKDHSNQSDRSNFDTTNESEDKPDKPRPTKDTPFPGDLKFPSLLGFLNFLTSLQRSLVTKTSHNIMDKIKVLKSIRDQLIWNIEDRFGLMFPKSRQRRGLSDESSFQFPSEAALMSISFLTFSVFLIKLVLQVIHIIKSKHYTYAGMTVNNMNTVTRAKSGMNARKFGDNEEDMETLKKVSAAIKSNPFTDK